MNILIKILQKLFNGVTEEELQRGISFEEKDAWAVYGEKDLGGFLMGLTELVPEKSILYLEGTSRGARDIVEYLVKRKYENRVQVKYSTIWPRPDYYHIEVNLENMNGLAEIAEKHAEPEVASHLMVYCGNRVILAWYDLPFDSIFVSKSIPEVKLKEFCERQKLQYKNISLKAPKH